MSTDSLLYIVRRLDKCAVDTKARQRPSVTKLNHVIADRLLIQTIRNLKRHAPLGERDLAREVEQAYQHIGKYYV